jgi:glycerophosphoryl diester phosphodiesterase
LKISACGCDWVRVTTDEYFGKHFLSDRNEKFMTMVIGHKGAPTLAAENSAASFAQARDLGADGVELDVRRVGDGHLAVWHDPALADGRVLLDTSWPEIAGAVDDLAAVLDASTGLALVNVEIKNWLYDSDFDESLAIADLVAAFLAGRPEAERSTFVVSCFHQPTADRARKVLDDLAPEVAVGWLLWNVDDPADVVDSAVAGGYAALHPHFTSVTPELVERAHAAGVAINTWTCNDPEKIAWLAEIGTDGIITDNPELALRTLGR